MALSSCANVEVRAVDQPKSIRALGLVTCTLASSAPTRAAGVRLGSTAERSFNRTQPNVRKGVKLGTERLWVNV
jgi:hypothetical protein